MLTTTFPYHRKLLILIAALSVLISVSSLYSQSIRLDESQSIWVATKSMPAILFTMSHDVHPPLYILLLHFFIQVFGTGVIATRTLSLLFFLATIPYMYIMAKESCDARTALLATIFFSLSPFVMWFSTETRMYTLLTLAATANNVYFLRMLKSGDTSNKFGYFLSALVGLFTHYFFLLFLTSQMLYRLAVAWRAKRFPVPYAAILVILGALFAPWAYYVATQGLIAQSQPLLSKPNIYNLFAAFVNFLFGFQSLKTQSILISLWPLIVIFFFIVFTSRKRRDIRTVGYFLLITFFPILFTFAASYIKPVFLPRYLIFTLPTLFLLVAWTLTDSSQKFTQYVASLILVIMAVFLLVQNVSDGNPEREDYENVGRYISDNATPRDIVAVTSPFTIYPIEYSYTGHARIVTIPEWDRYTQDAIPAFTLADFKKQLVAYGKLYYRMFLVLSYDQGYEGLIRKYLNDHYQLITKNEFSPGVELLVYRLRYD